MQYKIPFSKSTLMGRELEYIKQAIDSLHLSGDGYFSKQCHQLLENELGVSKALLTTSGTHALDMAALLLDVQPGDEVIVPAFTFVTSINAFVLRGATPVFIDILPDTLNIDSSQLESKITPKTKAIVIIHYGGVACEMDEIVSIANKHNVALVEDNALSLFGKYKGRYLGTFGQIATQSFHETKNFSAGEGGAILINDEKLVERAEIIREKGTDRSKYYRGLIDKYTWVDIGSSYLPSEILAAFLYAQLSEWPVVQEKRKQIWTTYNNAMEEWAKTNGIILPTVPDYVEHAWHNYWILMPNVEQSDNLRSYLASQGILAVFHYQPLHLSKMGIELGGYKGQCPVTEDLAPRLLRLPFYTNMTGEEQETVLDALLNWPQ